jgi:E3 ubiquitin-protein ligase HUWE1
VFWFLILKNVVRCMTILDSILFQPSPSTGAATNTSHGLFTTAKGIELIVKRLKYEVTECTGSVASSESLESPENDMMDIDVKLSKMSPVVEAGVIPYDRLSLLRSMLRLVLHLMQSSGTADGVRNLIESSLPGSVLKILQSEKFGASVFCIGILYLSLYV